MSVCLSVCLSVWQVAPRHLVKRSSSRRQKDRRVDALQVAPLYRRNVKCTSPFAKVKCTFVFVDWYIHSYPVGTFRNGWEQSMNTYTSL
jgi:hypothetical protein